MRTTVDRRHYCVECGVVRERGGRSVGHFIDRLEEVQRMLRRRGRRLGTRNLTDVERRIIIRALESDPLFADPWGSTYAAQRRVFIDLLTRHRPTVPRWMFEDVLV
ncbi:MAG TPA: hypothetical protein EYP43_03530 [Thermoplasmata archaeon]|nr:hypothetical protein [Thermoplasmata archaeon]